jgi:telomere length regulation protein
MENLLRVATPGKASDVLKAASAGTTRLSDPRSDGHKHAALSTPETALEILKSRPEETEVLEVLRFLDPSTAAEKSFDITIPGPVASQILQVLVSQTIVDHWSSLWGEDESGTPDHVRRRRRSQAILLRCLSSVPGIGALIARLRFLLSRESHGKGSQAPGTHSGIRELLILLSSLLKPHSFLWHIYSDIAKRVQNRTEQKLLWKELTSFLAAGKVLSTSAEALKVVEGSTPSKSLWIGEGSSFALWLGANISYMAIELQMDDAEGLSCLSSFMGRAVSLGYTGMRNRSADACQEHFY